MMLVQLSRNDSYDLSNERGFENLIARLRELSPITPLGLICKNYTPEELTNFLQDISKYASQIPCHFTLLKEEGEQLVPIYAFERLKFDQQMLSKYQQVKSRIDNEQEVIPLQISEHKRNRVLGKKVTPPQQQLRIMGHELNFEHEVANTGTSASVEDILPIRRRQRVPYYTQRDNSDSLINADNIQDFKQFLVGERNVNLQVAWQKIVSIHQVAYIDKHVMRLFLKPENYAKLSSGFLSGNLPVVVNAHGEVTQYVQLQKYRDQHVWALQNGPSEDFNEYTLVLGRDYSLPNRQSFIEANLWSDTAYSVTDLNCIFNAGEATDEQIGSILYKWCGDDEITDVTTLLSNLPQRIVTKEFLRGCIDILVTAGPRGLIVFLDQLAKIDISLIEITLKHQENFGYFASQDGIDKLVQLSSLSRESKHWWEWLVAAHARTGDKVIFSDLFLLFRHFEEDLAAELGKKLPALPFTPGVELTCNMQVMLQVIFEIVSVEPTQLHYLSALENGILQAHAAIKSNALRVVTQEMQLNSLFSELATIKDQHEFARKMFFSTDFLSNANLKNQYDSLQSLFLLFCARKQDDFENFKYDTYEQIRRDVNGLNRALNPLETGPALYFNDNFELPHDVKYGFVVRKGRGGRIEEVRFRDISKDPEVNIVISNHNAIIGLYRANDGSIDQDLRPNWNEVKSLRDPNLTRYVDYNAVRFTELDYRAKSSLLYIAAIASSGRRAALQQGFSSRDLTKFLQALNEFAGHFKVDITDLIRRMHENGLDENNCPTLAELAEIFDILHKSFPSELLNSETLDSILVIIKNHGDHALEIISNICAVTEKRNSPEREPVQGTAAAGFEEEKQQEPQRREPEQNLPARVTIKVNFISSYVGALRRIPNGQEPEKVAEVARAFALLRDYDSVGERGLLDAIERVSTENLKTLVNKLTTLDIKSSGDMLTVAPLVGVINRVCRLSPKMVVPAALDYLHNDLKLELKYYVAKVVKSRISITKAIESVVDNYTKYAGLIKKGALAVAYTTGTGEEYSLIRDGFNDVDLHIADLQKNLRGNVSEASLVDSFNKVANRLRFLRNDLGSNARVIATIKGWVVGKFAKGEVAQMIEVFFENFSLSAFMDDAIATCIDEDIDILMNEAFAPGKSLKTENKELHKCLWQFMKYGAKSTGFGLVKVDFDPLDINNEDRLKRECLKLADGIVLYNGALYHVQSDKSFIVKRIHVSTDDKQQAYDNLVSRINTDNCYRTLEFDSYRLIKIEVALGSPAPEQTLEEQLFKYVRELSSSQSALILYRDKLYTLYHQDTAVHEQADDASLKALFAGNFTNKVADDRDAQLLHGQLGADKFRNEYAWIKKLGISPVLFVSDTVNLYDAKFDVFCEVLRDFQEIQLREPQLFKQYRAIFEELALRVEVIDDLVFTIFYFNQILKDEPALKVRKLEKVLQLAKQSEHKVNLKALRLSMEELALDKYHNGTLQKILDNMIPFCMRGSLFPINVFKDFKDEPTEFLEDILQLAVVSPAKEVKLEEAEEEDLNGILREVHAEEDAAEHPIDVFALIKDLNRDFDPNGIKYIQASLLKALVQDSSKKQDFQRICDKIATLSLDPNLMEYYSIFQALNTWQKTKNVEKNKDDPEIVFTLEDIEDLLVGLESKQANFDRIYKVIFATRPYPNDLKEWREFFKRINDKAAGADALLEEYLVDFDRHPYGVEVRQKAEEHFRTTKVLDLINGMQRMPDNIPLTYAEKMQLVKEFSYVNALRSGAHEFYPVDAKSNPTFLYDVQGEQIPKPMFLHDNDEENIDNVLSTDELKQLANSLKLALQEAEAAKPQTDKLFHEDNRKLVLQYISVMFELYYRTTGIIPNPAQVITVIEGLDRPGKQLFEIETAEGKSVTTALFAGLLCAKKSTVFVPTSSDILVDQDLFKKKNDLFFEALGFNARKVDANTTRNEVELGCIYYGTSRNIDSIIAECRIMAVSLTHAADAEQFGLAIVKDEEDNDLDDPAQRNLAIAPPAADEDLSPTWIISAINKFIREKRYSRIEKEGMVEPDDKSADERNLKDILVGIAHKKAQKLVALRQIENFEPHLREFLDIADDVYGYVEGEDFQVLPTDEDGYSQATPINGASGFPERGNTHSGYVQAFLHDRLNLEGKHATNLAVEIAPMLIDSQSNKSIATGFDYFIGLSATVGSRNEVLEMAMPATRIPPFREKVRYQLTPQAVKNEADKHLAILDAIRFNGYATDFCPRFILDLVVRIVDLYKKTYELLCKLFNKSIPEPNLQPIIVFVNNPKEAQKLADKISGKINKAYKVQVITGKESEDELATKVRQAGEKNVITIGEPVLGRGMDYRSKHPDGIFVVKAFNSTLRGKVQVLGRCGRDDKPGTFLDILSDGEFSYDGLLSRVFGLTPYQKEQQVRRREEKINAESAVQRYFTQEVDAYIQVILRQFDEISHILKANDLDQDAIFIMRAELLQSMQKQWESHLLGVDPDNKNGANKYVRENAQALVSELESFKIAICEDWREGWLARELIPCIQTIKEERRVLESGHRLDLLIAEDVAESFNYRKLSQQSAEIQEQRIAKIPQDLVNQRLERYIDGRRAVIEYDATVERAHAELKIDYALLRLDSLLSKYSWLSVKVIQDDNAAQDIQQNFKNLVDALLDVNNEKTEVMQMYPLAKECLDIAGMGVLPDNFCQEELQNLRDKYSKNAASKEIVNRFKARLENIQRCLFRLGIKTKILDKVFADLFAVCDIGAHGAINMEKIYTALHKCLCMLENDNSIFPFAKFLFGKFDLKALLKQTIVDIDGLYTLENSLEGLKHKAEIGTCAGYFEVFLSDKEWEKIKKRLPKQDYDLWSELEGFFKDIIKDKEVGFAEIEELMALCRYYRNQMNNRDHDPRGLTRMAKAFSFSYRGVRFEDSIDMLLAKLRQIKARIAEDDQQVCFTQQQKYLNKKSEALRKRIRKKGVAIDTLQIGLRWNGVKVAYEVRISHTCKLNNEFAKFTGLTILDSYYAKLQQLMELKAEKEQERNAHELTMEGYELQQKDAMNNYRRSSAFGRGWSSIYSSVAGTESISSQKEAADLTVESYSAQISVCSQEIAVLNQQIEEIEKRMRKFGVNISADDPADIAPNSKTAVRTFDALEDLLTFENAFRNNDKLHEKTFEAVPVR